MTILNKKQLLTMLSPLAVVGGLAQAEETQTSRGALDVFVDHSYLDDTIKNALANGIEVKREDTKTLIFLKIQKNKLNKQNKILLKLKNII